MSNRILMLLSIAFFTMARPALADQITGQWCSPSGNQSVQVDYESVVTPGGRKVTANVQRHHFDYVIPDGEPDAGARFTADQLNDEQISVRIVSDASAGEAIIWIPCKPVS